MKESFDFENVAKKEKENKLFSIFKERGIEIMPDSIKIKDAYLLKLSFREVVVTIRILLNDYSGADIVITNMTTLPFSEKGKGFGSRAIQQVVDCIKRSGFKSILAVQVQKESEGFWEENNFVKVEGPNECNDFVYKE